MPPNADATIAPHRDAILAEITEKPGWDAGSFELELMAEWDQDRVPLIVAISNVEMSDFSPAFVPLPDGGLVSRYDTDGLGRIFDGYFADPTADDAPLMARLATLFGHFSTPVGELVDAIPGNPIDPKRLPRSETAPVLKTNGGGFQLAFYTYDYERMRPYDCTVEKATAGVDLAAKMIDPGE